jgi:hypothetical protein
MKKTILKDKKLYDVKVECLVPATAVYRVLAESPEEALDLIKTSKPKDIKYRFNVRKLLKGIVYDAGSVMIRLTKSLR